MGHLDTVRALVHAGCTLLPSCMRYPLVLVCSTLPGARGV